MIKGIRDYMELSRSENNISIELILRCYYTLSKENKLDIPILEKILPKLKYLIQLKDDRDKI